MQNVIEETQQEPTEHVMKETSIETVPEALEPVKESDPQPEGNVLWRATKFVFKGLYNIAYSAGGFLTELFGITTPRYDYALREYEAIMERERLKEQIAAGEINEKGEPVEEPQNAA